MSTINPFTCPSITAEDKRILVFINGIDIDINIDIDTDIDIDIDIDIALLITISYSCLGISDNFKNHAGDGV